MKYKRREKNISKLLMKTSNSMPNIFTQKHQDLKDFGIFSQYIDKQLSYYNLDPKELSTTQSIFRKTGIKIQENEKLCLPKMNGKKKLFGFGGFKDTFNSKDKSHTLYNKTSMMVSIKSNFFDNPLHSYNILRKNNTIAHDIVRKNIFRQKIVFKDQMNKIKANKVFYKKKMPFMKISTVMPSLKKEYVFFNMKNPPVEILNNDKNNPLQLNNNTIEHKKQEKKYPKSFKMEPGGYPFSKLICLYRYSNKNFPESREQFSLVSNENKLYLIGGKKCISSQEEIWVCDLSTISWSKIKPINNSWARFGHTAVIDRSGTKIYLYGGRTKFEKFQEEGSLDKQYSFCGIEYFDLQKKEFNKPSMSFRIQPEYRRNHIAELIGNDLVIMGGINENNEILNDIHCLNLNFPNGSKERWKEVDIADTGEVEAPFLFGHASALAVQGAVARCNKFSLYKYPDDEKVFKLGVFIDKIKIKGLYIFGGKSKEVGTAGLSNELYVLVVGKKPCIWKKIEPKGIKPPPRYFHSMSYYEKGNLLIVHGGRNDLSSDSFALNDTFIFDLEFLQWHKVTLYSSIEGFKVMPRCAHQSIVHNNKLIIFGGMNNQSYIGSCLFIIRLDPDSFEKNRLMISAENENENEYL